MAPAGGSQKVPACGFGVQATKKGELPLKVEKRALGKKVTIIPKVSGDATKLARALQAMLGVGGTVRQAEKGVMAVEVQGDQTERVTRALQEFGCLQGLSQSALDAIQRQLAPAKESVVVRNDATKFLEKTQRQQAKLSAEEERRRALEMEAEFYDRFWDSASAEDFSDVWEETLAGEEVSAGVKTAKPAPESLPELNLGLRILGMFAECGHAICEFWEKSGMTLDQFKRIALTPGARWITDGPAQKVQPSNLVSRQKLSDKRAGGRVNYFSATCSIIDNYQRGIKVKEEKEAPVEDVPEEQKMVVKSDEDGWCTASLTYVVPLPVPSSRLEAEELSAVSKDALRKLEKQINADLEGLQDCIPGVNCRLDCTSFGVDLTLHEQEFLHAGRRDTGGKAPTANDKEEMRLEKKLREISALRRRQVDGAKLDKLQADKVAKRSELFTEVAEMKLRRAEKELLRVFKRHTKGFQDAFWDVEWQALYGSSTPSTSAGSTPVPFGIFDQRNCDNAVTLSADGATAESRGQQWAGVQLLLTVADGEVAAFAVEVLEGLTRLGWVAAGGSITELGSDKAGYGFGGTGKKMHAGNFEPYGPTFKVGDVIHCEAEREEGRLQIGFAKNSEPCGVAFDVADEVRQAKLTAAVCGKGFKVRLISAESMPLEEATALDGFVEYDPPRMATVSQDFRDESEDCLQLWRGETINVSSNDGRGWLFGFFLDAEDPEDGGWFPVSCVDFFDHTEGGEEEKEEGVAALVGSANDEWEAPVLAEVVDDSGWAVSPPVPAVDDVDWGDTPEAVEPLPGHVEGLLEWLQELALQKYEEAARKWCQKMGAVSTEEVEENWEDFADELELKTLARKRLQRKAAARMG